MNPLQLHSHVFYFPSDFAARRVRGRLQSNLQRVDYDTSLRALRTHRANNSSYLNLSAPMTENGARQWWALVQRTTTLWRSSHTTTGWESINWATTFWWVKVDFAHIVKGNMCCGVKIFLCLGPHPAIQPSSEQCQAPWVAPDSGGGSCVFNPGSWRISVLHYRQTTAFSW